MSVRVSCCRAWSPDLNGKSQNVCNGLHFPSNLASWSSHISYAKRPTKAACGQYRFWVMKAEPGNLTVERGDKSPARHSRFRE